MWLTAEETRKKERGGSKEMGPPLSVAPAPEGPVPFGSMGALQGCWTAVPIIHSRHTKAQRKAWVLNSLIPELAVSCLNTRLHGFKSLPTALCEQPPV